jgi:hypothetical protein
MKNDVACQEENTFNVALPPAMEYFFKSSGEEPANKLTLWGKKNQRQDFNYHRQIQIDFYSLI